MGAGGTNAGAAGPASEQGHLVDVGGHRLYVSTSGPAGEGGPTAVFDSGAGTPLANWDGVPALLPDLHTLAYDRAGIGRSEPKPPPRDGARIVEELRELLVRSGAAPPYVLVGHSSGGLYARLFAALHPADIAALVLVDPSHENQDATMKRVLTAEEHRSYTALLDGMFANAPEPLRAERAGLDATYAQLRDAGPLDDVPLVVLSALVPLPPLVGLLGEERARVLQREWVPPLHEQLAASVPRGRRISAERSSHYIQLQDPALVADAIRGVLSDTTGEQGREAR